MGGWKAPHKYTSGFDLKYTVQDFMVLTLN